MPSRLWQTHHVHSKPVFESRPCSGKQCTDRHQLSHARGRGLQRVSAAVSPFPGRLKKSKGTSMEKPGVLDRFYPNITGFPFPLGPLFSRKTIRYEVRPIVWA